MHEVRIERMAYGGDGVGHLADGRVAFVPFSCAGDVIGGEITDEQKRYVRLMPSKIIEPSPHRVTAPCPYFTRCGGCQWQHITADEQLRWKRQALIDSFSRLASVQDASEKVAACRAGKHSYGYRNKVEFEVARDEHGKLELGFHAANSSAVIPVAKCLLMPRGRAEMAKAIQGALRYLDGRSPLTIERVAIRIARRTADLEIALWTHPGAFPRAQVAQTIRDAVPKTTSIVRPLFKGPLKERRVDKVEALWGKGSWQEKLGERLFTVSAPSFFQVNSEMADQLTEEVLSLVAPRAGMSVADLFSGVGTFAIPIALSGAKTTAIESYGSAVRDLRRNSDQTRPALKILGGDAAREIADLRDIDTLVVDPPRAGLKAGFPALITQTGATRIVYVSCDPTTLAHDMKGLQKEGFFLRQATPFDLFPQTFHVETVALLSKLDSSKTIEVKINFDEMDATKAESKATYDEIKNYVLENVGLKVSKLYVAQVKRKHGLIERTNYNMGEGRSKVPQVPLSKEKAIEDALRHFKMI